MRAVLQLASVGLYRRISPRVSPAPSIDGSDLENSGTDDEFADASAEDPPLLTRGWGALPPRSPSAWRMSPASRVPAVTPRAEPNPTTPICPSDDDRTIPVVEEALVTPSQEASTEFSNSTSKLSSVGVLSKWPKRPGVSRASRRVLRLWLHNARFSLQNELQGREALSDDDSEEEDVYAEANMHLLSTTEAGEEHGAEVYVGGGDGNEAYYDVAWLDAEGGWLGKEGGNYANTLGGDRAAEGDWEQPKDAGEWLDADGAEESWWEKSKTTTHLTDHEACNEEAEAQADDAQYATNEAQGGCDGPYREPAWNTDWYMYQYPSEDNSVNSTEVENHEEENHEEENHEEEGKEGEEEEEEEEKKEEEGELEEDEEEEEEKDEQEQEQEQEHEVEQAEQDHEEKDEALQAAAEMLEEEGGTSDLPQSLSAADEFASNQPCPSLRRRVRAVAAFAGDAACSELQLCEGEIVEVLNENASGWWQGRTLPAREELTASNTSWDYVAGVPASFDCGDGTAAAPLLVGWFPCTYVEWLPIDDCSDGGGDGSEYGGFDGERR
jgi:hypothetical protein